MDPILAADVSGVGAGFETWKEYGFAGLFVVVFLFLLWYLFMERSGVTKMAAKMAEVLERNAAVLEDVKAQQETAQETMNTCVSRVEQLSTYIKTRDEIIDRTHRR